MTDYNNLPDDVNVIYTDFVECQYCGIRFAHGDTEAMQNHWRDCPAEHPARVEIERLEAEVERLRAANAQLVEALTGLLDTYKKEDTFALMTPARIKQVKRQAISAAKAIIDKAESEAAQ